MWAFREALKVLDAGISTIYMADMDGYHPIHNKEELVQYYGWDMGSEEGDVTVIKHSVSCCRCGNSELLEFQNASDFIYFDDNMKELGWEKDKYGRWFCDECSYKGGDD